MKSKYLQNMKNNARKKLRNADAARKIITHSNPQVRFRAKFPDTFLNIPSTQNQAE